MSNSAEAGSAPDALVSSLPSDETVSSNKTVFARLSAMMLLEYIVFGSWFATLGLVLATHGLPTIIGLAYALAGVAAIVSPMFLGAIGDRFLASHKLLGLAHAAGGVVLLLLPSIVGAARGTLVLVFVFVYMLFFQPTLALTNSIAFRHLGSNQRLFPYIRVFGTIGWIVAGLAVGAMGLSASTGVFVVAAIMSFVLAVYSFTLPATPPAARGVKFAIGDFFGSKAFVLFRQRNFVILIICSLLTAISLGTYNSFASPYLGALGIENVAGVLAIGQISEVVFIVTIPFVLARLGMKYALLTGMLLWGVRFVLFAAAAGGHHWLAVVAIALHGICNDFFLILGAMYVDRIAPIQIKAQAQSLLILVIAGVGSSLGSLAAGWVYGATVASGTDSSPAAWTPVWFEPITAAAITAILWLCLFRYSRSEEQVRTPQPVH